MAELKVTVLAEHSAGRLAAWKAACWAVAMVARTADHLGQTTVGSSVVDSVDRLDAS